MPSRKDIFLNGGIYHIFNKTIDHRQFFQDKNTSLRFKDILFYYRSLKSKIRYSHFQELSEELRIKIRNELSQRKFFKVDILCYCFMPNHFHLLLKQLINNGIREFISDSLNSITRYYNILNQRLGPVFIPQFKSRRITTRQQLIHVSRYIHINPYSLDIVDTLDKLMNYSLSSLPEYLLNKKGLCNKEIILNEFNNKIEKYKQFIFNHADYQKHLEKFDYIGKWL